MTANFLSVTENSLDYRSGKKSFFLFSKVLPEISVLILKLPFCAVVFFSPPASQLLSRFFSFLILSFLNIYPAYILGMLVPKYSVNSEVSYLSCYQNDSIHLCVNEKRGGKSTLECVGKNIAFNVPIFFFLF